jgi:hypothetical protein
MVRFAGGSSSNLCLPFLEIFFRFRVIRLLLSTMAKRPSPFPLFSRLLLQMQFCQRHVGLKPWRMRLAHCQDPQEVSGVVVGVERGFCRRKIVYLLPSSFKASVFLLYTCILMSLNVRTGKSIVEKDRTEEYENASNT